MAMNTAALTLKAKPEYTDDELRAIWLKKVNNIRTAWTEFEEKKLHITAMPFKAIVELTQNCNFRCIMCPQSWEEKFKKYNPDFNMPMDVFVKIAEQLFPTATFIDLRGFGETTILPYWPEVVDHLETYPFVEWHLVTNLSLPRDDTWDKMIKLGFSLGFSCDGATKETFESIRVRSHFDRIRHNMGVIRDAKKKYGTGWIYFISTIQKKNIHELKKIVEFAHEFDVPEVQFKIVQEGGHDSGIRKMDPALIKQYVGESLDAALDLDVRVTFNDWFFTKDVDKEKVTKAEEIRRRPPSGLFAGGVGINHEYWNEQKFDPLMEKVFYASRVSVNQKCFKPYSFTYVNYMAEMGTCNHMMYPDMLVMGDLKKQSLIDVWNCEMYQDFRKQLVSAKPQDPRCQWCFKHRLDD